MSGRFSAKFTLAQQRNPKAKEGDESTEASPNGSPDPNSRSPSFISLRSFPSTPATPLTPHPQGLQILADPEHAVVDIVALHGIEGHREKTFTSATGTHWLRDFLPRAIPKARIYSWGYNANILIDSDKTKESVNNYGEKLVADLCNERRETDSISRPIIFVGHSLGGLVVKSALIHSNAEAKTYTGGKSSIWTCTYGIIFLGTPHGGGEGAGFASFVANIASFVKLKVNAKNLQILKNDSEWLKTQQSLYSRISNDFCTVFAYEGLETAVFKSGIRLALFVVEKASAVIEGRPNSEAIEIKADHREMARFSSPDDPGYKLISHRLWTMAGDAPAKIKERWARAKEAAQVLRETLIDPYSVAFDLKQIFDQDAFVGRGEELAQLHSVLHASDGGRQMATIKGSAGMGKTQLALAYAKAYRRDYSAVFWIDASDPIAIRRWFLATALRIEQGHPFAPHWKDAIEEHDFDTVVAAVLDWLTTPDNTHWLLIFDNYNVAKSDVCSGKDIRPSGLADDVLDTDFDIRAYLPKTSHGSILITTQSPNMDLGAQIPLGKLHDAGDGLAILENTSERMGLQKDPSAADLVAELDGVPLALALAGAYLQRNTGVTIPEYIERYTKSRLAMGQSAVPMACFSDRILNSVLDVSCAQIREENDAASDLLRFWACLDPGHLWFEFLNEGYEHATDPWFRKLSKSRQEFESATGVLCKYGLATKLETIGNREYHGYELRRSVHALAPGIFDKLGGDAVMDELAYICVFVSANADPADHDPGQLESHFLHVTRKQVKSKGWFDPPEYLRFTSRLDTFYDYHYSEAMFRPLFPTNEVLPMGTGALKCLAIQVLSKWYFSIGRYRESETLLVHVLPWMIMELGQDHAEVFAVICRLFAFYFQQKRPKNVRSMFDQLRQWCIRNTKENTFGRSLMAFNLGFLCAAADHGYTRRERFGAEFQEGPIEVARGDSVMSFGAVEAAKCIQELEKAAGPDSNTVAFFKIGMVLRQVDPDRRTYWTDDFKKIADKAEEQILVGDVVVVRYFFWTCFLLTMAHIHGENSISAKRFRLKQRCDAETTQEAICSLHWEVYDVVYSGCYELAESRPHWILAEPEPVSDKKRLRAEKKEMIEREKAEKREKLERKKAEKKEKLEREKQERLEKKEKAKKNKKSKAPDTILESDEIEALEGKLAPEASEDKATLEGKVSSEEATTLQKATPLPEM